MLVQWHNTCLDVPLDVMVRHLTLLCVNISRGSFSIKMHKLCSALAGRTVAWKILSLDLILYN